MAERLFPIDWVCFEQDTGTPGMGINTLIGVGMVNPLGPVFPGTEAVFPDLGPKEVTLWAAAIGHSSLHNALVVRQSEGVVADCAGGTGMFVIDPAAPTPSGDEVDATDHFNVSPEDLAQNQWILGINFEGDTPVANFTFEPDPAEGCSPLEVEFTDTSTNSPTSWHWEKNDGGGWVDFAGTPTAQNPTENFTAGTWDVRLTACNVNGCNTHTENNIIVSAVAPVASFTFDPDPAEGAPPLEVEFTDTSTGSPTSWLWEKNDGGGWVSFSGTPTVQNPTENFTGGLWSVRLTVENACDDDTDTQTDIILAAVEPVAAFEGEPLEGCNPLEVTFTDLSTNAPTAWHWEKNDGGGWVDFDGTPTAQNPVEDFATGTWSVRLTASNAAGSDTHTETDYILVAVAPVASFTGTPLTGAAPLEVTFTDTSTNDPTSWHWEKNDGGGWVDFDDTPFVQNPVEEFEEGVWSVRLTVENACDDDTATETDYVDAGLPADVADLAITGGSVTTDGDYKVATFDTVGANTGEFTVTSAGASATIDMLASAGGSIGRNSPANSFGAGGGGGGEVHEQLAVPVVAGDNYKATLIGYGGIIAVPLQNDGGPTTITYVNTATVVMQCAGGGKGGGVGGGTGQVGTNGGCGGGGSGNFAGGTSTATGHGSNGGTGNLSAPNYPAGGGGGAGQVGGNATTTVGGKGGDGWASSIRGTAERFGAGGGGGTFDGGTGGTGGAGGGGAGGTGSSGPGRHGVTGSFYGAAGGGGGCDGGTAGLAGEGFKGCWIVRWKFQ